MGKLTFLTKNLLNEPQLITQSQYEEVAQFLNHRNALDSAEKVASIAEKMKGFDVDGPMQERVKYAESRGVATLNISGALSHKANIMEALCGGASSYQTITAIFDSLVADSKYHTIVLDINSGGGEARGCFAFAQYLRNRKGDKKLIARTDSLAASAAYAIASVADEVIISSDAEVGSIGVISQLVNISGKLEKDGVSVETFTAGKGKDIGNPTREMTEEEMEYIQSRIDELYSDFVSHVAEMRNLDQDFIIKTLGAATFRGKDAVEKGLADKVMSNDEFATYLAELSDGTPSSNIQSNSENNLNMADNNISLETLQEQLNELASQNEELKSKLTSVSKEKEQMQKADLVEKASAWSDFGVDANAYADSALQGTVPVEMFNKAMEKAAEVVEAKDKALDASAGLQEIGDGGDSDEDTPEAKERARTKERMAARYNKSA